MNGSIIVKKNEHWYVVPAGENGNDIILQLIRAENPEVEENTGEIAELLLQNGWSVEEYRDFSVVA